MAFKISLHPKTVQRRIGYGLTCAQASAGYADNTDIREYARDAKAFDGSKYPMDYEAFGINVPLKDGRITTLTVTKGHRHPKGPNRWQNGKSSKHRCFVSCPDCCESVPAGRTHQHKCKA